MQISHVKGTNQTNFIEVRQYTNRMVNVEQSKTPIKSDVNIGFWRVKRLIFVAKEYLNEYEFIKN
jgi:hypothetical protein